MRHARDVKQPTLLHNATYAKREVATRRYVPGDMFRGVVEKRHGRQRHAVQRVMRVHASHGVAVWGRRKQATA